MNNALTHTAKFRGICRICSTPIEAGDAVRFADKKIVACANCAGGAILASESFGWNWAARLPQDVARLRTFYKIVRAAYLALPASGAPGERSADGQATRWIVGRQCADAAAFDAAAKRGIADETEAWAGEPSFDRLTVGQLFALRAAEMFKHAATRATHIAPSKETLDWGGFMGGETLHFDDDAFKALDNFMRQAGLIEKAEVAA